MLSAVLGFFSQDLAVDLGTTTTRIHQRGCGLVVQEPTVVAVHTDSCGRRRVLAVGEPARAMRGRTPRDIEAIEPVRDGLIANFEVAEALLVHLLRRCQARSALVAPDVVVAVPYDISDMARRAVRDSIEASGARRVSLVPRPLAAAMGADLSLKSGEAHLLVDVGGGATELSVLSGEQVVLTKTVPGGGNGFDRALADWLAHDHRILVGASTAEALRIAIGVALDANRDTRATVKGRCLQYGLPHAVEVNAADVCAVLGPHIQDIGLAIRGIVAEAPPQIAASIVGKGALLSGGASQLAGLDRALRRKAGLPVVRCIDPENAVAAGAGRILEDHAMLRRVAA